MKVPEFIKIGSPIWCGFAGVIEDVAVGETDIMVKVDSPKKRLLNKHDEWLPYRKDVMRPLTQKDLDLDLDICNMIMGRIEGGYTLALRKLNDAFSSTAR